MNNKFGSLLDMHNEADVEQIFVRRLLKDLGFSDSSIRPKDSISAFHLSKGSKKKADESYKPDFAILHEEKVRFIVEAKAPNEKLDSHVWQPAAYCLQLNRNYISDSPVNYYILTNGRETRLYEWRQSEPLMTLQFEDFIDGNASFNALRKIISADAVATWSSEKKATVLHRLTKKPISDVNSIFAWCHQAIHKSDNISQSDAFTEFVKLIALKLISDREILSKHPEIKTKTHIDIPAAEVKFSTKWINEYSTQTLNPLNSIQFKNLTSTMEKEIAQKKRKRIFEQNENINLKPNTISMIVEKLENIFLFGIDADLNGRLFETFLNATMRGKDLGQFFTPRSVVKLTTKLATLKVNVTINNVKHTDTVFDACCGSGGFLIDILNDMWRKVDNNSSLSTTEKTQIKFDIANNRIIGVDIARAPNLSRIARLNMYLHGDGGTRIYQADALDKEVLANETVDTPEIIAEKDELRGLFSKGEIDVAITNPPFAKEYVKGTTSDGKQTDEGRILSRYFGGQYGSLKSSLMFLERYHELLKIGGRLVTVIDDGILSGKNEKWFRQYMRDKFLIKAIVSLPGDAFQRSNARVKTSVLIAEKRDNSIQQEQPPVFMYGCKYVGIDDPARRRTLPIDEINRKKATAEIDDVTQEYINFLDGKGNPVYVVSPEAIVDRLDVKHSLVKRNRLTEEWSSKGMSVYELQDLVEEKELAEEDIISTNENPEEITYLIVQYNGNAAQGEEKPAFETTYSTLYRVHTGDIVISNIAASYGSIAVVPPQMDGFVVTNEYTILSAKQDFNPKIIALLLRSPEIRSEILLAATGISRTRIKWSLIKTINLPYPLEEQEKLLLDEIAIAEDAERLALRTRQNVVRSLETPFRLNNQDADDILMAFKPPK
ncbi:N-6 DNA methylase [Hymenobacter arcticus]